MPEWPIYECKHCGAQLEEDDKNIFYQSFGIALVIAICQGLGEAVGYIVSSGNETVTDIFRWGLTVIGLLWFVTKPKKLGERGAYGKHRESSNK